MKNNRSGLDAPEARICEKADILGSAKIQIGVK